MNNAAIQIVNSSPAQRVTRNLYYPCSSGYIFAVTKMQATMQLPFHGLLAITADGSPIDVATQDSTFQHRAMAMCPREMRWETRSTRLVCIAVNPFHRYFRSFRFMKAPHLLALPRSIFSSIDGLLNDAVDGRLSHEDARLLFDTALNLTHEHLPAVPIIDPRAQELVTLLWAHPKCTVAELASHLNLSYHRTSHLFADAIGIPVRTYQLWRKIYIAGEALIGGASITEAAHVAGFSDSAHYSSAFQKAYGCAPSALFKNERVNVFASNPGSRTRSWNGR